MSSILGIRQSLSGKSWRWRGGNIELGLDGGLSTDSQDGLTRQLLMARGIAADEDMDRHIAPTIRDWMPDPAIFCDMEAAAERIVQAAISGEAVTVYGDYDVDGATSAALLVRLLTALGLAPRYYIPDRLMEGYGPSGEALVRLGREGSSLIITVDCGSMAYEALQQAHDAGVDVIVVDHHKCASELPKAFALVNPNRLDEGAEAASHGHLAAVGVAFLLAAATVRLLRSRGYFEQRDPPDLLALLDLVALGTVADVAKISGLNRAFVAQGLKVMRRRGNVGMAALADAARLNRAPLASDLGFAMGPRINAGGRVGKSDLGVRLLSTEDPAEAAEIAQALNHYNDERRAIEAAVQEQAEALMLRQANRSVLCLAAEGWHPGVIGIVAGRIKEKTGKPALVVALDAEGIGKGSGRSINGVDLGAAVIAAREAGLLVAGGGHAMAAGFTVNAERLDAFADWIDDLLARKVAEARADESLAVDLVVAPTGLNPSLVERLDIAGPYGVGWPAPRVVVGPARIVKADIVGKDHVRLIMVGDDGRSFKAVAFRNAESAMGQALLHGDRSRKYWLAGRAKIDDWAARAAVELHIDDAAFAERS